MFYLLCCGMAGGEGPLCQHIYLLVLLLLFVVLQPCLRLSDAIFHGMVALISIHGDSDVSAAVADCKQLPRSLTASGSLFIQVRVYALRDSLLLSSYTAFWLVK